MMIFSGRKPLRLSVEVFLFGFIVHFQQSIVIICYNFRLDKTGVGVI